MHLRFALVGMVKHWTGNEGEGNMADNRKRIDRHIELEEKCKNIDLDSLHSADEDIDFFLNMVNN